MLTFRYSDPPKTDAEAKDSRDSGSIETKDNYDISNYIINATWSDDSDQAARKLEFTSAYNTPDKDKVFTPLNLIVGGFIYLFYRESRILMKLNCLKGVFFTGSVLLTALFSTLPALMILSI